MNLMSAVHTAVRTRWVNDANVLQELGGEPYVFSRRWQTDKPIPAGKYKWITIGDKTNSEIAVMDDGDGGAVTLTAHVWTHGYYEDEPAEELIARMHDALKQPLVLAGYGGVSLRREFCAVVPDPDDLDKRHGIVRYRISTLKV